MTADAPDRGGAQPDLVALLDDLHDRLLEGDFAGVEQVAAAVDRALAGLQSRRPRPSVAMLAAVRAGAQRNAPLLEAAIGGVRAARLRLFEVQQMRAGPGTYDRAGHRKVVPGTSLLPPHRS